MYLLIRSNSCQLGFPVSDLQFHSCSVQPSARLHSALSVELWRSLLRMWLWMNGQRFEEWLCWTCAWYSSRFPTLWTRKRVLVWPCERICADSVFDLQDFGFSGVQAITQMHLWRIMADGTVTVILGTTHTKSRKLFSLHRTWSDNMYLLRQIFRVSSR